MLGLKKKKKNNLNEQSKLVRSQVNNSDKLDKVEQQEKKEIQPKEVDISKYKDIEGITAKRLKFGLWYIEHRAQLWKVLIGFLIIIGVVSWIYTFYGVADYIFKGRKQDEKLAQQITETRIISHDYIIQAGIQDLQYYPVKILKSGNRSYDFVARVKNPNKKRYAYFNYAFIVNGEETEKTSSFILPEKEKYLMTFNQEFSARPANAQLKLDNLSWIKIDPHKISDWTSYAREYLDIVVSEEKFISAQQSELSEKLSLNQLSFKVTNKTAYNYWEVELAILLYNKGDIIGINQYNIAELMSGQTQEVEMSWPGRLAKVSNIEIIPGIDILDENNYIEFAGGIGEEK